MVLKCFFLQKKTVFLQKFLWTRGRQFWQRCRETFAEKPKIFNLNFRKFPAISFSTKSGNLLAQIRRTKVNCLLSKKNYFSTNFPLDVFIALLGNLHKVSSGHVICRFENTVWELIPRNLNWSERWKVSKKRIFTFKWFLSAGRRLFWQPCGGI